MSTNAEKRARRTKQENEVLERKGLEIRNESGAHVVYSAGIKVGEITRDPTGCWSYAPWRIVGDRTKTGPAGLQGGKNKRKLRGWSTRVGAAYELAIRQSGMVISALCAAELAQMKEA